jgi:dTDP-4-dehydrorhamnose reductase
MDSAFLVLLVGAKGQVGHEVVRLAQERQIVLTALDRMQLDITDAEAVNKVVTELRPGLLINTAAYTAVDLAENEKLLAMAVNRDGPANLAAACVKNNTPLIHLSTDYVFDGHNKEPYREDDPANPTGIYGLSKWEGEMALRERLTKHLILRVSWVFGVHGNNFVKTILRLCREKDELGVVADQHGCPTAAVHIAQALLTLAARIIVGEGIPWGTYHYCGRPATTWAGFAEEIIKQARAEGMIDHPVTIRPIRTSDYPTPARRPENSVLGCGKIADAFGVSAGSWQEGLRDMLQRMNKVSLSGNEKNE